MPPLVKVHSVSGERPPNKRLQRTWPSFSTSIVAGSHRVGFGQLSAAAPGLATPLKRSVSCGFEMRVERD